MVLRRNHIQRSKSENRNIQENNFYKVTEKAGKGEGFDVTGSKKERNGPEDEKENERKAMDDLQRAKDAEKEVTVESKKFRAEPE